ncbi:MAG TPA: DnaJ C-terminal domain-containing protein, partial [Candidatus Methylomirabilis sp.]
EAYAVLIDPVKRREYDRARLAGAPGEFRHAREDIFRDLFADPRASAIFEELAREFERLGMRVDRHLFHQTLFGGRAVVTGGVFIITPLTPVFTLFRLARAALRGAQGARPVASPAAPPLPPPRGALDRIARAGRWLLGLPPRGRGAAGEAVLTGEGAPGPATPAQADVIYPLRLTRAEATRGGPKRLSLGRGGELEEVVVTIPPGIRAGTKLRLRGKGRATPGARPGDLYLAVEIGDDS